MQSSYRLERAPRCKVSECFFIKKELLRQRFKRRALVSKRAGGRCLRRIELVSAAIKFVCVFVFMLRFHKVLSRYVWLQGSGLLLVYREPAGSLLNKWFKHLY
jgi:hypothetical protein